MYSILLVKKYKHLKIEGEKMVDFEKELQRCFWRKQQKVFFEFFKHSLDQNMLVKLNK